MQRLVIPALACAALACGGLFAPGDDGEAVIVSSDGPHLRLVSVIDGRTLALPTPAPPGAYGFARSHDSAFLYYAGSTTYPQRQILLLDARSAKVVWNELLAELEQRSRVPSLELLTVTAIARSPDRSRLVVAPGRKDGVEGLVVLDTATREPLDFVAPMMVPTDGMAMVAPSTTFPAGALAVAGSREQGVGPKEGWLFFLDGNDLTMRDSIQLTQNVASLWGGLGQVVAAPDGDEVYVLGPRVLFRYDVAGRSATATRAVRGRVSLGPDGSVYVGDSGEWDTQPSSGMLFQYSADLAGVDSIDLSEAAVDGFGPTIQGVAPSRDARWLYVLIGNAEVGVGGFPGQPKRVLVVDAVEKRIVRSYPLGDWGGGPIFLR